MNIALVIAGGVGARMKREIPKQFISVYDKPVIIYTLECFENNKNIDAICVVCVEGWEDVLRSYAKEYKITKLKWIVNGGKSGQESIKNGIFKIKEECTGKDNIVLIHDAIRPFLSDEIIDSNIETCKKHGNAITYIPCREAMMLKEEKDDKVCKKQIDRDLLARTQTPQTFYLDDICKLHNAAIKKGITNSVASCTLMIEMGKKIYLTLGSEKNIKLTTPEDLDIFKALLDSRRNRHD